MKNSQKDLTELDNEFHRKRGKALNIALAAENHLEFFIYQYFIRPQTSKTFFFDRVIVQAISFVQKINVFNEICKREKFDDRKVKEIIKLLNSIRETRNKIAHWETMADPQKMEISLMRSGEIMDARNFLKLDDKLINDLDEKRFKAMQEITELYMKYSLEGTIDEKRDTEFLNP